MTRQINIKLADLLGNVNIVVTLYSEWIKDQEQTKHPGPKQHASVVFCQDGNNRVVFKRTTETHGAIQLAADWPLDSHKNDPIEHIISYLTNFKIPYQITFKD